MSNKPDSCYLNDSIVKTTFIGKRVEYLYFDFWMEVKDLVNSNNKHVLIHDLMTGKISIEGITTLLEMLSCLSVFSNLKIAIILSSKDSYSEKFFDTFAKNWGLNIRHFNNEEDGLAWLA